MLARIATHLVAAALVLVLPAAAQSTIQAAAPTAGFRAEFLDAWSDTADKTAAVAEAGADVYAWRPAEDVRSTSEVLLHVAAANYMFGGMLGAAPPEGLEMQGYETSTSDPAEVAAAVRASFAHVRDAVIAMDDAAGEEEVEWFGGSTMTKRGVLLFMEKHASEHLGQLIAYLRVNGVTPPWSE